MRGLVAWIEMLLGFEYKFRDPKVELQVVYLLEVVSATKIYYFTSIAHYFVKSSMYLTLNFIQE